jgi:hypothetical protein
MSHRRATPIARIFEAMRRLVLGLVFLLATGDSCGNGIVGVQDYGSVTGRVLDASTNQPIANAIVSVGSLITGTADQNGAFTLQSIPIGQQIVKARMPGFSTASEQLVVKKDRTTQAGYLRLVSITKPDSIPTLAPPPTPTPTVTIVPQYVPPSPSESPSEAPPVSTPAPTASPTPAR